jgi:hypothetical protein
MATKLTLELQVVSESAKAVEKKLKCLNLFNSWSIDNEAVSKEPSTLVVSAKVALYVDRSATEVAN